MLKREYLQNAALGAGGWDRLTQADYGRIGGKLRAEYARLANMAEQVAAGEVTAAQAINRSGHSPRTAVTPFPGKGAGER